MIIAGELIDAGRKAIEAREKAADRSAAGRPAI
jgi:hypothetical protein